MQVRDVLGDEIRTIVTIKPRDTVNDVVDLLEEYSIGAVLVTEDGEKILGIISERDVVRSLVREQEGTLRLRVEDLMTSNVATCLNDDSIESAMETMTSGHFRHLPVVTADGVLDGIVSLGDLVKVRLRELEEQLLHQGSGGN
jgi:CBS domain-containing protein